MSDRSNRKANLLIFGATGWLFADLLLALAMLFLVATSVGHVAPPPPTPVAPTPTAPPTPTASPIPVVILNRCPIQINLTVNYYGIINNDPTSVSRAEQALRSVPQLQGNRAGIVFVYGGSSGVGNGVADQIANGLRDNVLKPLGSQHFVFTDAVYHDPLINLGVDPNLVELEVYVFDQLPPGAPFPSTDCSKSQPINVNGA